MTVLQLAQDRDVWRRYGADTEQAWRRHGAGTAQARRRHGAGTAQARRRLQRRRLNGANGPKSKKKIVVPWRLCSSMGLCSSTGVNAVSWGLCSSMDVM